ncbi:hypothetical protein TESG_02993 [Trichophyton tonsurans CBS 112818]|uniref:Uncharacterized protein n=1 Tax=Trichophyton tonsurans (strain CBS 112818) TaxID=647933 RepID=F2RW15_TRIT1|nr:hypothetical protein TESG_02993 [Trichophyton tonsurans CBS 112818]
MAQLKEESKEDAWIEVETEPDPAVAFSESPYASKPAMFRTSDGTIFSVPEDFVSKLPALAELRKENKGGVTSLSFDKGIAHTFFHCLCTGTYEQHYGEHPSWEDLNDCPVLWGLKCALRAHAVAKEFGFGALKLGAETHMKELYQWLPLDIFMDHIRENLAYFKDDMDWLRRRVQTALKAAFTRDPCFYERSIFLETIGHSSDFDRLLAQVMGKMYRSMRTGGTEEVAWSSNKESHGWENKLGDF